MNGVCIVHTNVVQDTNTCYLQRLAKTRANVRRASRIWLGSSTLQTARAAHTGSNRFAKPPMRGIAVHSCVPHRNDAQRRKLDGRWNDMQWKSRGEDGEKLRRAGENA